MPTFAFHPAGNLLAAIDRDENIRLFDVEAGEQVRRLSRLATGSNTDERSHRSFDLFPKPVPLAFSSDGRLLTNGGENGISVWQVSSGQLYQTVDTGASIDIVELNPNGDLVATVVDENVIQLYSTVTGKKVRDFHSMVGKVNALKFSPDGKFMAVGSGNGSIRILEADTGREARDPPVFNICDRPYAVSGTIGEKTKGLANWGKLFPGKTQEAAEIVERTQGISEQLGSVCGYTKTAGDIAGGGYMGLFTRSIRSLALSPGGTQLAYQLGDNTVRVLNLLDGTILYEIDETGESAHKAVSQGESAQSAPQLSTLFFFYSPIKFSPDGSTINTIGNFKTVSRWHASTGEKVSSLAVSARDLSFDSAVPIPIPIPLPIPGGSVPLFGSTGNTLLTATLTGGTRLWDLERGGPPELVSKSSALFNNPSVSPDGRLVVTSGLNEKSPQPWKIFVKEVGSGKEVQSFQMEPVYTVQAMSILSEFLATFSPDSKRIALQTRAEDGPQLRVYELATADELYSAERIAHVEFSPDGNQLAMRDEAGQIKIVDTESWSEQFTAKTKGPEGGWLAGDVIFSSDGRRLAAVEDNRIKIWDLENKELYREREIKQSGLSNLVFRPGGDTLSYTTRRTLFHWDLDTNQVRTSSMLTDFWGNLSYSPDGSILALGGAENRIRLFDVDKDIELGSLVVPNQDDWLVVTPSGRLDTRWLEDVEEVHWVVREEPYTAQPLELFMREYYEPQLLSRLNRGETFQPLPDLSARNRALPEVEITRITETAPDQVEITVAVRETTSMTQRGADGQALRSGARGLRLFRDQRLVGYAPADLGELPLDAEGAAQMSFAVPLPRNRGPQVEFSAYAFNADNVKGLTSRRVHNLQAFVAPFPGQAYLISIGANDSEDPHFALRYAANDARLVLSTISERLQRMPQYREVVEVPLISAGGQMYATTSNVKGVFDLLAGRPSEATQQLLRDVPAASGLQKAMPEDLILITFSGHGYTDSSGVFYFVPSDIGSDSGGDLARIRPRLISSDMLSNWLLDVDAGEMMMIIDACYAAAVVEARDFKPGPLGSKGLGQLSYDKGMRILTATQANDVAVELAELEHGILTYALVVDGIHARKADFRPIDNRVMASEWLRYAVKRVPGLYDEARRGEINTLENGRPVSQDRGLVLFKEAVIKRQQPAVFDFSRGADESVLMAFE